MARGIAPAAQRSGSKEIRTGASTGKVAFAQFISGGLDDIIATVGPDDLVIIQLDQRTEFEVIANVSFGSNVAVGRSRVNFIT